MPKDELRLGFEWNPVTGRTGKPVSFDLGSHLTLLGPTRSGKGATLEIPNLLLGLRRFSCVSVDPTGQNAAVCARARRKAGSRVWVLNPQGLHVGRYPDLASIGCNVMVAGVDPKSPRFFEEAAAIGEALIAVDGETQRHWPESARGLVTGLIMWVRLRDGDGAHLGTVLQLLTEAEQTDSSGKLVAGLRFTAAQMIASGNFQIASLAGRFIKDGSREIDSIRSTAETATRWLLSEPMRADLSKNGIDWGQLTERPTTVFVILPAEDLEFHSVWLRLVVSCALNAIYRKAGNVRVQTLFMMAEFFACGHLRPVLAGMGQGAKYGVRLWPVLQDIGQLQTLYGPHGADTFIGNSGCLFAFTPGDGNTAEFLSRFAGEHAVEQVNVSDDPQGGPPRLSFSVRDERIWPPHKIRDIPRFHGLVWKFGASVPQPVYCPPYWEIPECRRLARPDPYHAATVKAPRRVWKLLRLAARVIGFGLVTAATVAGFMLLRSAGPETQARLPPALRGFLAAPPPASAGAYQRTTTPAPPARRSIIR